MRVQFTSLGQAVHYLKTCRRLLERRVPSSDSVRIPSQRIRNVFCNGFGYSSYSDLQQHLKQTSNGLPEPDVIRAALTSAFTRAVTVVREFQSLTDEDANRLVSVLAAEAFAELIPQREKAPRELSEDLEEDGWDCLRAWEGSGDPTMLQKAEQAFRAAVSVDQSNADAYCGIGCVYNEQKSFDKAIPLFEQAIAAAGKDLGDVSAKATHWDTLRARPYLRARYNLGLCYWQTGDIRPAMSEFRHILRREKRDSQGVGGIVAQMHLLLGEIPQALRAFRSQIATEKNGLAGDPDQEMSYGLALFLTGDGAGSILRYRYAFFRNLYHPEVILSSGRKQPVLRNIWHGNNVREPGWALEYWRNWGATWKAAPEAVRFLGLVHSDPRVVADLNSWVQLRSRLDKEHDPSRRGLITMEEGELTDLRRLKDTNGPIVADVLTRFRQ